MCEISHFKDDFGPLRIIILLHGLYRILGLFFNLLNEYVYLTKPSFYLIDLPFSQLQLGKTIEMIKLCH